jgi:hypothetical protein
MKGLFLERIHHIKVETGGMLLIAVFSSPDDPYRAIWGLHVEPNTVFIQCDLDVSGSEN